VAQLACRLLGGTVRTGLPEGPCEWQQVWAAAVAKQRPAVVVMIIGLRDLYDVKPPGSKVFVSPGDPVWTHDLSSAIDDAVSILTRYGAHVVIPVLPCIGDIGPVVDDQRYKLDSPERLKDEQEVFATALAKHRDVVSTPDLDTFLCPQGTFENSMRGVKMVRSDGVHFTSEGADLVANWLLPVIRAAAPHANLSNNGALPLKDELSHRLTGAGYDCPFRNVSDTTNAPVIVDCTKRGASVRLRVFTRTDLYDRFMKLQGPVACKYAREAHEATIRYATGDEWLLTANGPALDAAARVLDAGVTSVRC
jgi:hypothetical protein